MSRCEDWPCCGHEAGCCPDYDPETGEQLNMVCVCGAKLPVNSRYSICRGCMHDPDCMGCMQCEPPEDYEEECYEDEEEDCL